MAKSSILLVLLTLLVVAASHQAGAAVATKKQLSPAAQKTIDDILGVKLQKAIDDVVAAAPPAKQKETLVAVLKHIKPLSVALDKAKETGDEKKIARLAIAVEAATASINAAPADKKLETMEESLGSVATPSTLDCPDVDKAYCEMQSKIKEALDGVVAAAPGDKTMQAKAAAVKKTMRTVATTTNKAYAEGDEKKIAQIVAAYTKAANMVIVAPPADKLNVMEKTFASAAAA